MNSYGLRARKHWEQWRPRQYSQLENPDSFFTTLGEEISQRVDDLSRALAGSDQPGEGFLAKVGRLNMARFDAEATVLREMALLEPEPDVEDQ